MFGCSNTIRQSEIGYFIPQISWRVGEQTARAAMINQIKQIIQT